MAGLPFVSRPILWTHTWRSACLAVCQVRVFGVLTFILSFLILVAGVGFEPHGLKVMHTTSVFTAVSVCGLDFVFTLNITC